MFPHRCHCGSLVVQTPVNRERLTTILALVICSVWAVAAAAAIVTGDTIVLAAITPVMLIVAGFMFGFRAAASEKDSK
jgi:ATP/ADP translocase